jgi:OPA family glycerol-3-phosphate transporter-like MFS transporter
MQDRIYSNILRSRKAISSLVVLGILAFPKLALAADKAKDEGGLMTWVGEFAPIAILIAVVAFVLARLPRIELGHSDAFRRRRVMNWLPLGLTYAFLYMGRYNLTVAKKAFGNMQASDCSALMGNDDFGYIFMVGTVVYGCSFLINGPLTDRFGGKFSILVGAGGSALINLIMGLATYSLLNQGPGAEFIFENFTPLFCVLYGANMYFQSFGAVAIVKTNAPWFHVRERGVFGAIFGILISLGVYFAFDWGGLILKHFGVEWVFFVPAGLLVIFWFLDLKFVFNTPGDAGQKDFDTEDASSGDDGPRMPALKVFKMMLTNPVIMTIAAVEFCSGFLRQAIMQWYPTFAKQTHGALGLLDGFVLKNWGLLLCCAGIMGGVTAGIISDRVFNSRRGPVAFFLYACMLLASILLIFVFDTGLVGWLVIIMSMAVIGVHGMLSGTASMDFGGRKNVGIAVGIIDGFVYLGTGVMALTYAIILPKVEFATAESTPEAAAAAAEAVAAGGKAICAAVSGPGQIVGPATDPSNWIAWPVAMVPMAVIGTVLAIRVWHAKPKPKSAAK